MDFEEAGVVTPSRQSPLSDKDEGEFCFAPVNLSDEFQIYSGQKEEDQRGEQPVESQWMNDLDSLSFRKPIPEQIPSPSPSTPQQIITFEEVPPIYNSSHSSGSHGRPPIYQSQPVLEEAEESFEVITYDSPVVEEEGKQARRGVDLGRMKVEGVEGSGELATSATERVAGEQKVHEQTESLDKEPEEPSWPELTIQLPVIQLEESKTPPPPAPMVFSSLTSLSNPSPNPAFLKHRFGTNAQKSDANSMKLSLQPEFEEDAMGEAREWQAYSANPELNDDQQEDRGDEFSLDIRSEVAIRTGGEKQYTSETHPLESNTLESFHEVSKKPSHRRSQKIDLNTRRMIAEARLVEEVKDECKEPVDSETHLSPDVPASTPLKFTYSDSFQKQSSAIIIDEFRDTESDHSREQQLFEEKKHEEEWNRASAQAYREMSEPKEEVQTKVISYAEAWSQFEQMDISDFVEQEPPYRPMRASWLKRCFGAGMEDIEVGELKEKCRRILVLVKINFDNSPLHLQILMTVWKLLTGTKSDCPRYGSHWDEIGFQGTDPSTDLRGMGIFGLLQLLYFSSNFNEEAKMVLAMAQQPHCSFPFAAISLNISKVVVEALREQCLNEYINKWRNVFDSVRDMQVQFFYVGTYLYWFQLYSQRRLTIADVGALTLEISKEAKRHPDRIFQIVKQVYRQKGVPV